MKNGWKITAIIFIVLFVLETILVIGLMKLGTDYIEKENECSYNICGDDIYTAYYYDSYDGACYCYQGDKIALTKWIG